MTDSLVAQARAFEEALQYDSALVYYQKALHFHQSTQGEQHPDVASSLDNIGVLYYKIGGYDQALEHFDKALAIYRNTRDAQHPDVARTRQHMGLVYWEKGDFEQTLEFFHQALEGFKAALGDQDSTVAELYDNLGNVYRDTGNFELAFQYLEKALQIRQASLGLQHADVARSYNNIGILYDMKGDYDQALDYYNRALELWRATLGEKDPDVAMGYQNLGITYYNKSDYDQAFEYLSKALSIKLASLDAQDPSVGRSYLSLGVVYNELGHKDQALENFGKALTIFKNLLGERSSAVATIHHNIGAVLDEKGEYDQALEYYNKSLEIDRALLGTQHSSLATTYHNIGNTYFNKGNSDEALAFHSRALKIYQSTFGAKHPYVASSYQQVGNIYRQKGHYSQALGYFQLALHANVTGFDDPGPYANPPLDGAYSEVVLLETLYYKAQTLAANAAPAEEALSNLEAALATYILAGQLIDRMRHGYQAEGSKLFLSRNANEIFEHAIQTALQLYRLTNNTSYLEDAFLFSEKSKAGVLLDAIAEARAKQFAGIPDSLLQREHQLRLDLAFYERSLIEEQLNGEAADSIKITLWQDNLFFLQEEYRNLLNQFETDFPAYHDMKYSAETATASDLQQQLLDSQTALVSYFTGDDSLYIITLTKEDLTLTTVAHNDQFATKVPAFRQAIVEQNYDQSTSLGHTLFQTLLAPIQDQLTVERLILIPDGVLCFLPFEALLIDAPAEEPLKDYRTLPYLIRDYAVTYAYSATLLLQTSQRRRAPAPHDFIAFAPVFGKGMPTNASQDGSSLNTDATGRKRAVQKALPASRDEVISIRDLFRSQYDFFERLFRGGTDARVYLETAAREARLKEPLMAQYRFVHLATHGLSSDEAPELSRLWLVPEDATAAEDGVLYLGEVYALKLNADLVVLSACETGLGKLARGEGLIGLTRGFLYAGAENVMVSLWQVPDAATRDLMVAFYQNVLAGVPRSEALRRAKLKRLQGRAEAAAPYYWASFVIVGR